MYVPGPVAEPLPALVSALSQYSCGLEMATTSAAGAAAAWSAANRAFYIPLYVPANTLILKMFCINGGTINGNIDLGLYGSDGTRLVSSGSVAHAGANTIQELDITDTLLVAPGRYYMAMASNSGTATLFRFAPGSPTMRLLGAFNEDSAFPLPATATFAAMSNYVPIFGVSARSIVG
jgi:hypothetical protein